MEIYQIKHFIAVVEAGGFTKGAQRIAISQPAISISIAKLEDELEVKLLDRRHSRVVPTAAGMLLLDAGKGILQACSAVKAQIKATACRKPLRIGVLQPLSSTRISNLLSSFERARPLISFEVVDLDCAQVCDCEQLFGEHGDRELDVLLTIISANESKFAMRTLFKMPYLLAVREDHRFGRRQTVSLSELDNEPFILPNRCAYLQDVTKALVSRGVKIRVVYRTDRDDRALALVAAGIGLALVPGRFEFPAVRQVPISDLGISRAVGLLWPPTKENDDLKEFVKFGESFCWTA